MAATPGMAGEFNVATAMSAAGGHHRARRAGAEGEGEEKEEEEEEAQPR